MCLDGMCVLFSVVSMLLRLWWVFYLLIVVLMCVICVMCLLLCVSVGLWLRLGWLISFIRCWKMLLLLLVISVYLLLW